MKPEVQILLGPVASGKSTYSQNAAKSGVVIVNDDAIVLGCHGGDYSLYDKKLKPLYKSCENNLIVTALALGRSVVVDRGVNGRRRSRQRLLGLAHSLDVPVTAVLFQNEGAEVHARRRASSDGRGYGYEYWLRVAEAHEREFEAITESEGFSLVIAAPWSRVSSGWWSNPNGGVVDEVQGLVVQDG